jgi:hypothetical protein
MSTRRGKYNAQPTEADGYTFDSKAEYRRYAQLKLLAQAGEIERLEIHPSYVIWEGIDPDGKKQSISYVGDFAYVEDGVKITEDIKGGTATQTAIFKLKAKMFRCRYPDIKFVIVET